MREKIDKRERAALFRRRLTEAMARAGSNRSALARAAGVDRSTIAQLLGDDGARLPNGHLAADCARALGVSLDWLLGLSDRPERPGEIVAAAVEMTGAARTIADDQILDWHREAEGLKIRHVPAMLPDVFKTEEALAWEFARFLGRTPGQAIGAMSDRRDWLRRRMSDYEIALPLGDLEALAAGAGYYRDMPPALRRPQIEALARTARDSFPAIRIFLFDARRVFSAPVTVFGARLAVIYVGRFYLAMRSAERVRALAEHFDGLVREAEVDARDAADWLDNLAARVDD